MTEPDFSDFYRFLVSLGIVLISVALLLPWLFLRESFDARIPAQELTELTASAQALISIRQSTALWFLKNIVWLAAIPASLGLILLCLGVFLWWFRKQTVVDEKQYLEIEKLRREIEEMTPVEVAEKVVRETAEEQDEIQEEKALLSSLRPVHQYFRIEEMVMEKLAMCFSNEALLRNRRIGRSKYDAILLTDGKRLRDVIIEVKVAPENLSTRRFESIAHQLSQQLDTYVSKTGRKSVGVGLLIVSTSTTADINILRQYRESAVTLPREIEGIQIRVFSVNEFSALSCEELRPLIDFDLAED